MKVPPLNLTPEMNRVGMTLPLNHDFLVWRPYTGLNYQQTATAAPPSPLEVKSLPSHLSLDPRTWSREDVVAFLRWVEREYDLPTIDHTKFCMNGKALMMLNKQDLTERAPDAGDIVHNTLQQILSHTAHVPPSPITPHHPIIPNSPLTTSATTAPSHTWPLLHAADLHSLGHLLQQNSSVTLSPAHSEQSGGSPRHPDNASTTSSGSAPGYSHSGSQSDSEDSTRDASSPQRSPVPASAVTQSNFNVHALASFKHITDYQRVAAAAVAAAAAQSKHYDDVHHKQLLQQTIQLQHHDEAHQKQLLQQTIQLQQQQQQTQHSQLSHHLSQVGHHNHQQTRLSPPATSVASSINVPQHTAVNGNEDTVEPGTNGRLLWDFLQQLLNDREGRYSRYIAWRNAETGVFKIVDPQGLARLWGIQKNHLSMNYDKMSRALRYYYRVNILRKVQGERHCYQFLRNPTELKNIKNISSLKMATIPPPSHQSMSQLQPHQLSPQQQMHMAVQPPMMTDQPEEEEEGPTDLSMSRLQNDLLRHRPESPRDLSIDQHYVKMEEDDVSISVEYHE